ncbi:MAG: hypothetical protein BRD35_06485, partial [Bacteroidetes bacterium QH_7_62_13]
YATIMAYPTGDHSNVKHFSNPNVSYDDQSTGTSSRYNADALETTYSTIKDFRVSNDLRARFSVSGGPRDNERTFSANPCGGSGTYNYTWYISYNGPGDYGGAVSSQKSFTKPFPEGTHYVKLVVNTGSQTDTAIRSFYVSGECDGRKPCIKTADSTTEEADGGSPSAKQMREKPSPTQVTLHAPRPNPVSSSSRIAFDLPEQMDVTLTVYDLMGRQVATLARGTESAGTHRARLGGASLPSGTYVVRLRAGETQKSRRITVIK